MGLLAPNQQLLKQHIFSASSLCILVSDLMSIGYCIYLAASLNLLFSSHVNSDIKSALVSLSASFPGVS